MAPRVRLSTGARRGQGALGTFAGVFTPSILTILGIILFLRLGFVVGNAGLGRALLIIGLANLISVLTSISLSAIATNLQVKGGGDYYLISRTLGVEFGGALGLVLFLAQSVSVAFYSIGFGEAVAALVPQAFFSARVVACVAVGFLFVFAWLGADWATRLQYVIMAILASALVSFFIGGVTKFGSAQLVWNWSTPERGEGFWVLFALFFPAVTGFTQGVSMSGDLKNPGRSLPLGTFCAVGLSIVVYFAVAVVFSGAAPLAELGGDYRAMWRVSAVSWLVHAGVIAATLSSAMASFLGAPRILQSLAADRVFPFLAPFARGAGSTNNPRRGVLLSGGIAAGTILVGDLNFIAPVISMFFLISYGLLNYATYFEARTSSPAFRPRFRWFDPRLSLLGFLACLAVMLAINPAAGGIAVAVLFGIYQYLKRTAGPARWADSSYAYHFQRAREHLLAMAAEVSHPRDWRPQLLALSDEAEKRERILQFAAWLEGGSGLTTAVQILEGDPARNEPKRAEAEAALAAEIKGRGLEAFARVLVARDPVVGLRTALQSFGVGPLRANTLLLNWLEHFPKADESRGKSFANSLRAAVRGGCNVVALDAEEEDWQTVVALGRAARRIDVWWLEDATGRLMLLLAYLVTRHDDWGDAGIRVLVASDKRPGRTRERMQQTMNEVRIDATVVVVSDPNAETVAEQSGDAGLVFIPLRLRGSRPVGPFGGNIGPLLSRLRVVALCLAAEDIDLLAEPEDGVPGEIAAASDALAEAEKKARAAQADAEKAAGAVDKAEKQLDKTDEAAANRSKLEAALDEAKKEERKTAKRAEKAREKVQEAAGRLDSLLGRAADDKKDKPDEEYVE